MNVSSASILICTYNRAALLREALQAMNNLQRPERCDVEIIVVDNNSTDNTASVVANAAAASSMRVVALHEPKQGKSFALNRGLAVARGDILALTDDDVWPHPQWLSRIVERFRERDITFVFGKVLPRWGSMPPPELLTPAAHDIWGPLALVDYGDAGVDYVASCTGQRLPIGANLAFRRSAVVTVGGWRTDLGKVDNTLISGEDHEIFCRLRRFNLYSGFYDPEILVKHYVPARRLTRHYFRQWFYWSGKTHALMLQDLYPDIDLERAMHIGGTPRFLWRQTLQQFARFLRTRRPGTPALLALTQELRLLQYCGLIAGCWKHRTPPVQLADAHTPAPLTS
jgi:glycosyltransferase involved in cell wall biosynthesis